MANSTSWNAARQEQKTKQDLEAYRQQLEDRLGAKVVIPPEEMDRAVREYVRTIEQVRSRFQRIRP